MKKLFRAVPGPVCLLLFYGLCLVGFVGCQGGCASTDKVTYKAAGVAVVTVDAALTAWGDYVAKNHPGAAAEQKVADAYKKYQASVNLVADTAIAYQKAKAENDPSLPTAQANLNVVIAASAAALGDLESIITGFGIKL